MKKVTALPGLWEMMARSGKSMLALWPLLLIRILFAVLQYSALVLCLIFLFGSLFLKLGVGFLTLLKDPRGSGNSDLVSGLTGYFTDPGWVVLLAFLVVLYASWCCFLWAFFDGGSFAAFWNRADRGEGFSLSGFFRDGLRYLVPMFLLQMVMGLFLSLALVLAGLVAAVWAGIGFLMGFSSVPYIVMSLFLALVGLIALILFSILFTAFDSAAKAGLTRGERVREALGSAWDECKRDRFRFTGAVALVTVLYFILFVMVSVLFLPLSWVPLIGILFKFFSKTIVFFFGLCLALYVTAVTVSYFSERPASP